MGIDSVLRSNIVEFLLERPAFQDENGRKAIVLDAGLDRLLPDLELSGTQRSFIVLLVEHLDRYGRLPDGRLALTAFLQAVSERVGQDGQRQITDLCERIVTPSEVGLAACPYRGLEVFREQDADLFFGRADLVGTLQQMVAQQPFVAVIGASGSGKSSVVYAGLIPLLRRLGQWHIACFRPGKRPFHALAAALVPLLEPELDVIDRIKTIKKSGQTLTDGGLTIADIVAAIQEKEPDTCLLLFADQFEELYTLCPAGASRERFLDGMLQIFERSNTSKVCWLLTLRADFLSQVLEYDPLAKMLDRYPPKLSGRMTEEQLRAVIEEPAQKKEVSLEPGLSDRILRDAGQEPGHLPLLEFALQALWQRMSGRCLTHAAYDEIGGVNQALMRHADAVLARFETPEAQAKVRRVLVQLVSPGLGTQDTRQVASRAQVADWEIVQRLANARLVVTSRSEESQEETVEVVHEALIRHWQPLQAWMQEDREFRVWQNGLRQAIRDWDKTRNDDGALLRGARLIEAEEKLAQDADALSDDEKAYIEASLALRRDEERRRKGRTLGLAIGFVLALILAGLAILLWQRAEQQSTIAQQEQARAEQEKNNALRTQSLFLADLARQENEKKSYLKAVLLALEALPQNMTQANRPYVPEAELQLFYGATYLAKYRFLEGHTGSVWSAAFSPDGRRIVTASRDGTARVWDAATGAELACLTGHEGFVESAAFSPDGTRIVTASWDGTARVWDAATGAALARLSGHEGGVLSAAFSPDGTRIVTASRDGTARVWNAATGAELARLNGHTGWVHSASFSPDGTRIVTASWDGTARVLDWDAATGAALARLTEHADEVLSAAFSPDGTRIVTASRDETVRIWDAATGAALARLSGHEDDVLSAVFSPDGTRIVTASDDKTAWVWDAATGAELARLSG
ncbi:hypothetical protein CSB45_01860, partial [candidate division KSB3 bacterium]